MSGTVADGGSTTGFFARLLGNVVGIGATKPRLVLWLMVLLGCAGVGVTVSDLKLKTSRSDLLAPSKEWTEYKQAFGGDSDLVVVVKTQHANTPLIQSVLDDLGDRLEREPEYFSSVLFKIDQTSIRRKALQYLSESELKSAIRRVNTFSPVLQRQQWDLLKVEALAGQLNRQVSRATATQTSSDVASSYAIRLAESLDGFLEVDGEDLRLNRHSFESPWPDIVEPDAAPIECDSPEPAIPSHRRILLARNIRHRLLPERQRPRPSESSRPRQRPLRPRSYRFRQSGRPNCQVDWKRRRDLRRRNWLRAN